MDKLVIRAFPEVNWMFGSRVIDMFRQKVRTVSPPLSEEIELKNWPRYGNFFETNYLKISRKILDLFFDIQMAIIR